MVLRTQLSQSIVADAKRALFPEMQACFCCLIFMCLVRISLVWSCNLFVSSVIVAGPMGQAILSSLFPGFSSLLVPYRFWIALFHVLELCQIIQLLKQMRLLLQKSIQLLKPTTKADGIHGSPFGSKGVVVPVTPDPVQNREIATSAATNTLQQLEKKQQQVKKSVQQF